jgi:demethylmenaquinone methyltransferase/2-methoxy-6-polyprenyl-1,4-benzoquinol methylase
MTGTTPRGVSGEQAAAEWVRGMFGRIAGRYDLLNHLLSFNLDRRWRARVVERVADVLERPGARVLDLCCGTGDVLLALEERRKAEVLGSDFCHPMLVEAARKIAARGRRSRLFEADALALPLADHSLDLITIAFGFRNLANYGKGLEELLRVLKPGGVVAILEFSQPANRVFAALHIAADHDDLNPRLRQFVGHRAADAARGSGKKSCRRHLRLLGLFLFGRRAPVGLPKDDIGLRAR